MNDEINIKDEPPVEQILRAGLESVYKLCVFKLKKEAVPIEFEEAFKLFTKGILEKIQEVELGLYAITREDERALVAINRAKAEIPPDAELKLVAVPRRTNSTIIDPSTGQGAVKDDKKIILSK